MPLFYTHNGLTITACQHRALKREEAKAEKIAIAEHASSFLSNRAAALHKERVNAMRLSSRFELDGER